MKMVFLKSKNRFGNQSLRDRLFLSLSFFSLSLGLLMLVLTVAFLLKETGFPFSRVFRFDLIFSPGWSPLADPPDYRLGHAWISSFYITGIGLLISIPIGFGIGVFSAELAPPLIRKILQPALELLAGIPAVVYGFFGYVTLVRLFEHFFALSTGETVLAAGIILGVMMLPFIASTSAEAFRSSFAIYRESVLSLGVNQWTLLSKIVWVHAFPGLLAAVALGFARGIGETLAVLMLSGNSVAVPQSILDRAQPVTALLATELGETMVHSPKYQALFSAGFILLIMVLIVNFGILLLKKKLFSRFFTS
ncbi:MAG: phosphate ABC transporter permease subunit PstC [Desulfobacteraceae bacterium]|nr:MAG: phosphate ABC transporter permease subunit PstC [Desulfobacteraceae bacterium]